MVIYVYLCEEMKKFRLSRQFYCVLIDVIQTVYPFREITL